MMHILFVFGTRPEAIKLAPVIKEVQAQTDMSASVCVTSQHREMLDQVLRFFEISPDHDLEVMQENQDLNEITSRVLTRIAQVFAKEKPDLVIVHGDTSSTFAASLAAFYSRIPVGHVEAGLRTHDLSAPWPEEANRKLTGALATLHFAPTEQARLNLLAEGVDDEHILLTGNTVVDALLMAKEKVFSDSSLLHQLRRRYVFLDENMPLLLVTGHRRESFGEGFENICRALRRMATGRACEIVYPVHLNPRVKEPVTRILGGLGNVHLLEPLSYPEFIYLMSRARIILTDSGGVQEEAPSLGIPVLVMRDKTERPEGVAAGVSRLVGTSVDSILAGVDNVLTDSGRYRLMSDAANPYGDGRAAERIVQAVRDRKIELAQWLD